MAIIDDKVVAMSFESSKFESGVTRTIDALEKLKKSLKFPDAGKGLNDFSAAASKVDLSHISKGVDSISSKLGYLSVAAKAIFVNIALQAAQLGKVLVKTFTVDPIRAGYGEYITKINAIQTILANTQAAGTTLEDVSKALRELNRYSDQTIYNFGQMARNIGTFTAAGVDLNNSVAAIKGIANLAALSGSSADQAATAMYQLSQALSAGRVNMMDWISVRNAGMGGAVFQRMLAQTAVAMGTLKENMVQLTGPMKTVKIAGEGFAQSLTRPGKDSWLTSDVLTTTLKQFTGDLKAAQLAAIGFNDAQISTILKTARTAKIAATNVKDLGNVFKVAGETAGSGWATSFEIVFGTFTEARKTFTALSTTINGFINKSADARNKVLSNWKALGGRAVLIDGISTAFKNLYLYLKPIGQAFRDIFPKQTGKSLYDLTVQFRGFAESLKPTAKTMMLLRQTFQGLFAVFHIGWQLIQGLWTAFTGFEKESSNARTGILEFTASFGQFLVSIDEALQKGNRLTRFFEGLGNVFGAVLGVLSDIAGAFKNLFSGFTTGSFSSDMGDMSGATNMFSNALDSFLGVWEKVISKLSGGPNPLEPIIASLSESFAGLGPAIGEALSNLTFDPILQVIQTGLFAALVLSIKKFLGPGAFSDQLGKALGKNINAIGGGLLKNIGGSFKALEGSMVSMQTNIKAKTLKEIAIAIALLAGSVIALSFVDPKKLAASLTAMGVAFGELIGAMALLVIATKTGGFVKLPIITASLIALAFAIDLLTLSVLALSLLSWEQLAKGLAGVAGMLVAISAAAIPLSASSRGLLTAGIALIPLAIGLRILASAVGAFGEMNLTEMGKGFLAISVGLGLIAAATLAMPLKALIIGPALIAIAIALKILANVMTEFGNMDMKTMGKGLLAIGLGLGIIAGAMHLFPVKTILIAAGLLGIMAVLRSLAGVIEKFGGQNIKQTAQGLIAFALALGILAAALHLMTGTAFGAAALGVAAVSLALLVPSILLLGRSPWQKVIKGLVVLAGTLAILGVAAAVMGPLIPALIGLGVALVIIGGGMALLGAGLLMISTAFSALVIAVPMGMGILIAAFNELMTAIPEMTKNFILGMLEIVQMIAIVAPEFVEGIVKIIEDIVGLFVKAAPTVALAFGAIIGLIGKVITDYGPQLIASGYQLLMQLLSGISNNIEQITVAVAGIIVKFLTALSGKMSNIVTAGAKLLVSFLRGIANNISKVVTAGYDIIIKFVQAITTNIGKVLTAGVNIMLKLVLGITNNINRIVKAGTDAVVSFVTAIGDAGPKILKAGVAAATKFVNALAEEIPKLAQNIFDALIKLINGMAVVIGSEENLAKLRSAGKNLAWAMLNGMTLGLAGKAQDVYNKAKEIGDKALSYLKKPFSINSPSKETMALGASIMEGLTLGLERNAQNAYDSAIAVSNGVIGAFNNTFQTSSPSKVMMEIGKFVGQGFAMGLRGSKDDINGAFVELNEMLSKAIITARETIASEQAKLDELRKAKKPDTDAIKKSQAIINQNEDLLKKSIATRRLLTKNLADEHSALTKLSTKYDQLGVKLSEALNKMKELEAERVAMIASFKDKYSATPDLSTPMTEEIAAARQAIADEQAALDKARNDSTTTPEQLASAEAALTRAQEALNSLISGKVLDSTGNSVDILATYLKDLEAQTTAVAAYGATLDQLRKLGLDDATYRKLVEEGTADQAFADQLLAGGKTAVQGLNKLDKQLDAEALKLATKAGNYLGRVGRAAQKGLIKGLREDRNELRLEMEAIAKEMLDALKKALKQKSPSKKFEEVGVNAIAGLVVGLTKTNGLTQAMGKAADDALTSMKSSMAKISQLVSDELNPSLVLTPILDLSRIQSQSGELARLTNLSPITAAASYGQAAAISSEQNTIQLEELNKLAALGPSVKFEQNNYSPKALSDIEIYRQTKNQLSQVKSLLGTS